MSPRLRELSAPGRAGLSVLALEGPGARALLEAWCGRALRVGAPRLVRLRALDAAGELESIDEALALVHADDAVELHVHGSPAIVARLRALERRAELERGAQGEAAASPGEAQGQAAASLGEAQKEAAPASFEERAWRALAEAPSEAAARILLDQAQGALRAELERLVLLDPAGWRAGLQRLQARARTAAPALVPPRIALAGPASAGKSTLFNVLLGETRALVDARPGTTRDALLAHARIEHESREWLVELGDAAGQSAEDGELAQRAQALARELALGAQLVLWCDPHARELPSWLARARVMRIATRADERAGTLPADWIPVSALADPLGARAALARAIAVALELDARAWSAGAAVPCEPELIAALPAWAELRALDRRWRACRALLGPRQRPTLWP